MLRNALSGDEQLGSYPLARLGCNVRTLPGGQATHEQEVAASTLASREVLDLPCARDHLIEEPHVIDWFSRGEKVLPCLVLEHPVRSEDTWVADPIRDREHPHVGYGIGHRLVAVAHCDREDVSPSSGLADRVDG